MLVRRRVALSKRRRQRSRHCCGLTAKDGLQFLSSMILPLMLGVFTVVITFQKQKLAQEQRIEDMNLARQQRLEDRNESRMYREQDRNESQLQREQERNESRLQREQDWNIAQLAQATQNKVIHEQYQDEIFVAYIEGTADLLKQTNGVLTSDPLIHTLVRAKTLNTIRQLYGIRQIHIIRFLYESGQLTNTNESRALDISTAELVDIVFENTHQLLTAGELSLAGVYLVNSTFNNIAIK